MLRRLVAVLSLFAFLAYGGWSNARPCPMHDGVLAQLAMGGQHESLRHHGMPEHDAQSHQCSCIGSCSTGIATALPSPRVVWRNAVTTPPRVAASDPAYVAVARAHTLPFATAPPRAARIA